MTCKCGHGMNIHQNKFGRCFAVVKHRVPEIYCACEKYEEAGF